MKLPQAIEKVPGQRDLISNNFQAGDSLNSLPSPVDSVDTPAQLTYAQAAALIDGELVLTVVTLSAKGRTRRTFLSLSAAQKALDRAEARGASAIAVLVRLNAVGGAL